MKKWMSAFDKCDICDHPIKGVAKYFVDGCIKGYGCWGLMCPKCFNVYGTGLGCGVGQKYDGTTGILLEGGCEDSE